MKTPVKDIAGWVIGLIACFVGIYFAGRLHGIDEGYLKGREHGREIAESEKEPPHTCEPCDRRHAFPVGVVR